MLDNLFSQMGEKQEEMRSRLADEYVEAEVEDRAIVVKANGNREIINIDIDSEKLDLSDSEMLEDLLVIAVNQALEMAAEREAAEAEKMLQEMMPPGMGNLFG